MRRVFSIIIGLAWTCALAAGAPSALGDKPAANESLGNKLIDDLAPVISPESTQPIEDERNQSVGESADSVMPRFDDLGEDIGQPSGPLSLVRVRQGMHQAAQLLAPPTVVADSRALTQVDAVQRQIVRQLDELIAELSKQCQACQQGGQQSQSNQSQASQQPAQQASKPVNSSAPGNTAARDSTTRLGEATAPRIDKANIDAIVKDLWGHLPERSREQMRQSFSPEFLPKYELEIEDYYRRLSEEKAGR